MIEVSPVQIIRKKRDGKHLADEEIRSFISAATRGDIPDYQVSAWLMATYFSGMDSGETASLTRAMIESGSKVEFPRSEEGAAFVDKHSTGGVGDKVSLIIAPLAAAMGLKVPMVAGRGLGHTGGTLDKLESIPGFSVGLSISHFKDQVQRLGCAIMGQTKEFVPADKLLYSLRDVTATIDCVPLITASILSKKAAEGISGLVMDIKFGSGAFMKNMNEATALAKSLQKTGIALGLKVRCVLTDMGEPLGSCIGNSLEVLECVDIMRRAAGMKPISHPQVSLPEGQSQDVRDLSIELAAHMAVVGNLSSSLSAARLMARKALASGAALRIFSQMCDAQGATVDVVNHPETMPVAPEVIEVHAPKNGVISRMNNEDLGWLIVDLGGGRHKANDRVDPSVGIVLQAKLGHRVTKGTVLARIHFHQTATKLTAEDAYARCQDAFVITSSKITRPALIRKVIA